jgi:putative molybdopterin biosynthesis protein
MGEDMVATQFVLPAGHALRPVDLGAIAATGHDNISVRRKPRVAILPTGSELVEIGTKPREGEIIEFNSVVLAAQLRKMGAEARRYDITKDNFEQICSRILEAAKEHDLILLNAGSSAGAEDFSAQAVELLGRLIVHGVAVRPGHPVILGVINKPAHDQSSRVGVVPIIGVPGYPVSAALTIDIFVEPLIAKWLGHKPLRLPEINAQITKKITSPAGDDDYIRVAVGKVGEKILAAPLGRGAGVISSLVQADGLVVVPRGVQGLEAGDPVTIRLYRSPDDLEKTIFCIGSHDITIDILSQHIAAKDRRLTSSNVGSIGGLVALARHEAHLAGSHLLDPATGEFNIPYLKQYLPGLPVRVVTLVGREQGLLVQPNNPKRIKDLNDLINHEVRFINRQRGAGTRVLLDYQLGLLNINPESIQGYNQEEYTHLGVAAAISSGRADCGLGIAAAAQALGLEFIPLFKERYDLIIPTAYLSTELLDPFFEVLADPSFKKSVASLPGYDVSNMGKVVWEA